MAQNPLQNITINGTDYPFRIIIRKDALKIRLRYKSLEGHAQLTLPRGVSLAKAMPFLQKQQDWLDAHIAKAEKPVTIKPDAVILYRGEQHRIIHDDNAPRRVTWHKQTATITIGGPQDMIGARLIRWMKAEARRAFTHDIAAYCTRAQVDIVPLKLSNAKARWGSCSKRGGINVQWRLIMAPDMVRRSVVAHEVAHLSHMNHSAQFYAHLDDIFEGERATCDQWLKDHGRQLYLLQG